MNNEYDILSDGISKMSAIQERRFRRHVLRGNVLTEMRTLAACVVLWNMAESDARRKPLWKASKQPDQIKITAYLVEADQAGKRAVDCERQRQIALMHEVLK